MAGCEDGQMTMRQADKMNLHIMRSSSILSSACQLSILILSYCYSLTRLITRTLRPAQSQFLCRLCQIESLSLIVDHFYR